MENVFAILAINPGSTSTKIAVYENDNSVIVEKISHSTDEIKKYKKVFDQYFLRKTLIIETLNNKNYPLGKFNAVVGRGGLLKPLDGGTYIVNQGMVDDLKNASYGEHASNLGGILAFEIGKELSIPAYIVDPVVVDEMEPIAKITGLPIIERRSVFHALNHKAVARRFALQIGRDYNELNLIVAHLGGGITVGAHREGRVVEVNNGLDGEGPFTPERVGKLPTVKMLDLCFESNYRADEIKKMLIGGGGLVAHFGTNDARNIKEMMELGGERAKLVYEAMAYQVAREIGACAATLSGKVDAVILTGGLAYDETFCEWIKERVSFIAQVYVFPGENELGALAQGALRILRGAEEVRHYEAVYDESEAVS